MSLVAVGEISERESSERNDLPFLSIAIFGPSGSGKSSLLRTLVRYVNDATASTDKDLRDSVHALPVLQPDRFAEHDHFLYAFLATALEEEKEQRERRERQRDESHVRREQRYEPDALSPVQQRFQELSDYLRVIDEPEKSRDYDPLGLSLERLERHTSALRLKGRMRRFIDSLADELAGRGAGSRDDSIILLPVDDADMSPQHLVTSLQIYQTYLLHARLVPVFTFTDRTAEELLRGYFHRHLLPVPDGVDGGFGVPMVYASPGEGTRRLPVGDQLALQYLARCFPVRNRIRLGPAPARFRSKHYIISQAPEEAESKRSVKELLLNASRLLYGAVSREAKNPIRAVLRPSTLRRQVHVVDEMVAAGVESLFLNEAPIGSNKDQSSECDEETTRNSGRSSKARTWVRIFDQAAWSLMNVHRDVLREYQLYLEDLYSWTGEGLRRILLETILSQPIEARRALLHRWRFRLSSRRAETLSLLAANVFRPWMPGEEPIGEASALSADLCKALRENEIANVKVRDRDLPAATALLWFLDLLNGFYQPQVLAWNRPNDIAVANPQKGRVSGLGWNLESGPVNAIRAAEANDSVATAGMLFLDPQKYSCALDWDKDSHEQGQDAALLLRCWTYCGYSRGRYWAAVSFWRGLSLIGQLLRARRQLELEMIKKLDEKSKIPTDAWDRLMLDDEAQKLLEKRVRGILRNHLIRGLVPGQLVGEGETGSRLDLAFRRWDRTLIGSEDKPAKGLEEALVEWVKTLDRLPEAMGTESPTAPPRSFLPRRCGARIELMPEVAGQGEDDKKGDGTKEMSEEEKAKREQEAWKRSLLRRLHGDDIVGSLLSRLNATFIDDHDLFGLKVRFEGERKRRDDPDANGSTPHRHLWSAGIAMTAWTRVFLDYWRGLAPIQDLLRSCPLLKPFSEGPVTDRFRDSALRALLEDQSPDAAISEETMKARVQMVHSAWKRVHSPTSSEAPPVELAKSLEKLGEQLDTQIEREGKEPGQLGATKWRSRPFSLSEGDSKGDAFEDEERRFRSRLGLPETPGRNTTDEEYESWLERHQIDAFMRALPGVSLFYALPRVRPAEFKPEQPISAVKTRVEIDRPVVEVRSPVKVEAEVAVNKPITVSKDQG